MDEIIHVLIVDDHPFMRRGIKAVIEQEAGIKVVGEANTGESAIQLTRQVMPDVVLMDLQLPDMSGIEAIQKICSENPSARVLALSNFSEDKTVFAALEAGAFGYLLKVDAPEKIVKAIRDVVQGNPTLSSQAERGLLAHLRDKQTAHKPDKPLTSQEAAILRMMAEGMTNTAMAERACISEGTVRTHISHILRKLNLENRAQLVLYAVRQGLVNLEDL